LPPRRDGAYVSPVAEQGDWLRTISALTQVREIWWSELDGIVALGGCFVLTMHPQVIERPHRLAFLEQFIADVKGRGDVWVATGSEIADRVPAA